jgi:mediator of RNA polymerase II transcription subunit 6
MRYGDEYMDENPITGHPGAFNLTNTGRKARDNLAVPTQKDGLQDPTKVGTSLVGEKASDAPPTRKGSKSDKTPKTPGIPKPKRKKSKVLNSAGGVTPI